MPDRGAVFVVAVGAIENQDFSLLNKLLAFAEAVPEAYPGLLSSFGWVPANSLRGITKALLEANNPIHRSVGLASCAMHLVDPGLKLNAALAEPTGQAVALATAGRLGRLDLLPECLASLSAAQAPLQFEAARAALLLGDRSAAIQALSQQTSQPGPRQIASLCLVLKVLEPAAVHALLKPLSQDPAMIRPLIRGIGAAGDPHYVPWLIKQMSDPKLARLAGESFSLITGLDLAFVDLDGNAPDKLESGPNDDPADTDVAMDEDESLPWPDPGKISAWWSAHGARFKPGTRYFMGEAPSIAHCRSVLRGGFQRQRIAAAEYLCLLAPGTPLFNTAAPAWRQERLLAQMGP